MVRDANTSERGKPYTIELVLSTRSRMRTCRSASPARSSGGNPLVGTRSCALLRDAPSPLHRDVRSASPPARTFALLCVGSIRCLRARDRVRWCSFGRLLARSVCVKLAIVLRSLRACVLAYASRGT